VTGTDTAVGIRPGSLALRSGTMKVKGLTFELTKADVEFVGEQTIDATYALTAVKRIALWEITVNVKGRTSGGEPKVEIESSPPLPDDEVRDLLEKTRLREQI
jgi:autotransporter translocation and assembly factor TamB